MTPGLAYDLIDSLRNSDTDERKDAALDLARIQTQDGLAEIVRMVEGRRRLNLKWYNYNDQLIGVEAMGESGMPKALEYLRQIYTPIRKVDHDTKVEQTCLLGQPNHWKVEETVTVDYPKARGKLSFELGYTYQNSFIYDSPAAAAAAANSKYGPTAEYLPNNAAHRTIAAAIRGLEKCF